jgi:prepilin-type N-terminal cleavage/methylation domain-containing protein
MKNSQSGFTLIELLVVISIVSLISSIIFSASYSARAKAVSSQIQSQTQQVQKSIVLLNETTQTGYVDPGNTTSYYCVGKTAGQTCKFWGETLTGNAALKAATDQYMPAFNVPMVRVDGLEYQGIVYKCAERNSTGCTGAALYWAQSNESTCKAGKVVVTGVGGVICGKNADGVRDNYVGIRIQSSAHSLSQDTNSMNVKHQAKHK